MKQYSPNFFSKIAVLFLLIALAKSPLAAQIVSGSIVGTVTDTTGAVIVGATVRATNQGTNISRESVTNAAGSYSFATLPPGQYTVAASQAGFKQAVVSDIELLIDQVARVDLTLEVGEVTEQVTVEASAVLLQTDTPTVGQVIEEKPIEDLPLNGRNFVQLATLSAGVIPATGRSAESSRLGRTQVTAHVAGARGSFNSYLLDGMENRGARFGEIPILPSVDAVKEFKIQRNYYSAEYGQNAGVISLSIKSGTNALHGSVFEFLRNDNLDARQFFDRGDPPEFKLNQFGAAIGGPIVRDRTFFFGSYEGRRQRRANQGFARLPEPQWLSGDFSDLSDPISDPFANDSPFPNNRIPQSRLSQIAQNFNEFIPTPNVDLPQGNFEGAPSSTDDFDQFHVRIDHRFSDSDMIFGRYSWSEWDIDRPGLTPFSGLGFPLDGQNAIIQETHLFGPTTVNTVKVGYSRGFLSSSLLPADQDLAAGVIGFKNLSVLPDDYSLPRMSMVGFSGLGHGANSFRHWTNTYALSDTVAMVRGNHNLTFGGDVRHQRVPQVTTNGSNGRLSFSDRFTGFSVADYVLGAYTSANARSFTTKFDNRFTQYSTFVQDDWKVSPKLTLNIGLRYEYNQPWREKGGSEGVFDPEIPGLRLANDPSIYGFNITAPFIVVGGVREGVVRPDFMDLGPRFGMAYRLSEDTVIRTGYGIFYAMNQGNDSGSISRNPGASVNVSGTNSPGFEPELMDNLFPDPVQAVTGTGTRLFSIEPEKRTPNIQQWNFNIQQRMPGDVLFEIGYVGSKGSELMGRQDLNQARLNAPGENLPVGQRRPFSQFQSILEFHGGEVSNYHGMTVRVERRFAHGFGLLSNYTWSKSMDTSSRSIDDGASPHHIGFDRGAERAISAFDVRHRFVFSSIWELPFGPGKPNLDVGGFGGWIVGGWQINSILQLQTGNPFSVTIGGDRSNTGVFATQRPNRIGDGNLSADQQSPDAWFDTSAFVPNPPDTFGNAGRNVLWQDGVTTFDLSVFKNNYIGERYNVQFRAEFFNLFNNVNFGRPNASVTSRNFGVVGNAGNAREIQFALKFIF